MAPQIQAGLRLLVISILASISGLTAAQVQAQVEPVVVQGNGDIVGEVNEFREVLGQNRQEIDWDGVPDSLSAPHFLTSDIFRSRGALLSTPGLGIQVSADSDNPTGTPPRFGHVNPEYPDVFRVFSPERLFSPIGSNVVDLRFVVPGTDVPATVRGFGAVYTDVDTEHASFEYFDRDGNSLGFFTVPISEDGLSFLGVAYDEPVVARVQITYGTTELGPDDSAQNDVAVMDDFIFG